MIKAFNQDFRNDFFQCGPRGCTCTLCTPGSILCQAGKLEARLDMPGTMLASIHSLLREGGLENPATPLVCIMPYG